MCSTKKKTKGILKVLILLFFMLFIKNNENKFDPKILFIIVDITNMK